jgi:hypothetical protein
MNSSPAEEFNEGRKTERTFKKLVERLMPHSFVTSDNNKATEMGICLSFMSWVLEQGQLLATNESKTEKSKVVWILKRIRETTTNKYVIPRSCNNKFAKRFHYKIFFDNDVKKKNQPMDFQMLLPLQKNLSKFLSNSVEFFF